MKTIHTIPVRVSSVYVVKKCKIEEMNSNVD